MGVLGTFMNTEELARRMMQRNLTDYDAAKDAFDALRLLEPDNFALAHDLNKQLRQIAAAEFKSQRSSNFYDLYDKTLLFDAPHDFDAFLRYVEGAQSSEKKFYAPRRKYLLPVVKAYQEVLNGSLKLLTLSLPKRAGKAVTLDTPIPTPSGFKRMGDICVGDIVIGKDGNPTVVTDVFPQGTVDVYNVSFSDGAKVKTCMNHLWSVKYHDVHKRSQCYQKKVVTTGTMLRGGIKENNHNIYAVEYCEPVNFNERDVPLDPYVLGAILGDGTLRDSSVSIVSFDKEVTNYIASHLPSGDTIYCQDSKKGRWIIKSKRRKTDAKGHLLPSATMQILSDLGLTGKLSHEKNVPIDYIYNSAKNRWLLLSGLLDTDGFADANGIEYSTTSQNLRDTVIFLVRSLGGRASYSERMGKYTKNGVKVETRKNYRVHIYFPEGLNPFTVAHKRDAYCPKRKKLYHYIDSITYAGKEEAQCICVDNEDHLFLCSDYFIPTHNSQLGINFANFISGRNPNRSTLMEGTGDDLVKSFYLGCLEYLQTPNDYRYYDIFPEAELVQTNADSKFINLKDKSRFPTIMCRSIDARQVGLSEATNVLYLDDCVAGRDEAKNRVLLDQKWEVISGDIIGRAIEGTPIIATGTRYSLYDPIGRLQEEARKQHWPWKAIEIPALDPVTDESNYEYYNPKIGRMVFTTAFFREQREMLSAEQFESEFQQQPFEAKGLLFPECDLNRYFQLPADKDPDAIIAVCDTAEGGGDSVMMPIAYIYGDDVFIEDVVFDNSKPEFTKPQCAKKLFQHKVSVATFESNNAGTYYSRDVEELLKGLGGKCSIRQKRTISNKQTRIEMASDGIMKHFWFKDRSLYAPSSQYALMLKELTTYTRTGKVPHDDSPDGLAMLENEVRNLAGNSVRIFARPY